MVASHGKRGVSAFSSKKTKPYDEFARYHPNIIIYIIHKLSTSHLAFLFSAFLFFFQYFIMILYPLSTDAFIFSHSFAVLNILWMSYPIMTYFLIKSLSPNSPSQIITILIICTYLNTCYHFPYLPFSLSPIFLISHFPYLPFSLSQHFALSF